MRRDGRRLTPGGGDLLLQAGLFGIEGLTGGGASRDPAVRFLPLFQPLGVLALGGGEGLTRRVRRGGESVGLGVFVGQPVYQRTEFGHGGGCGGIVPPSLRRRRRVPFAYESELLLRTGAGLLGGPLGGQGPLLRRPVDMAVAGAGGDRVFGRPADRAGLARDETCGQLGRDAPQAAFAQVEPGFTGVQLLFTCGGEPHLRLLDVGGERVTAARRFQAAAGRGEESGELLGAGGGLLRGVDASLEGRTVDVPVGKPRVRLADQLVVCLGLPVQPDALPVDPRTALLGLSRRVECVQLLPELPFQLGQLVGARVGELRRQQRPGPVETFARGQVRPLRLLAQVQCGGDPVRLAGAFQPFLAAVVLGPSLLQGGSAPRGLLVPLLEAGAFALGVQGVACRALSALGLAHDAVGDVEPFAGRGPGDRRPLQHRFGEARFAGPGGDRRGLGPDGSGRLGDALGEGEDPLVGGGDPGLGAPAQFGEAFLDGGEAAGVEGPAEEFAAGLGVRAQEAGEVALRQQDHLAELVPAHADELGQLLADLLVRLAERLPAALGVVTAQPALRLLHGEAVAALLRAGLGRAAGDFEAPAADGQLQLDLGGQVRGCVVAAQGGPGALPGAGDGSVQGEADGVQDGRLPRTGGSVEQEEAGGGEGVEVDFLGGAERAEGGDTQAVQSHLDTSRTVSSTRTSSNAARSTVRSRSLGPLPPRTWATKSSAIWWSSRPLRRWA